MWQNRTCWRHAAVAVAGDRRRCSSKLCQAWSRIDPPECPSPWNLIWNCKIPSQLISRYRSLWQSFCKWAEGRVIKHVGFKKLKLSFSVCYFRTKLLYCTKIHQWAVTEVHIISVFLCIFLIKLTTSSFRWHGKQQPWQCPFFL